MQLLTDEDFAKIRKLQESKQLESAIGPQKRAASVRPSGVLPFCHSYSRFYVSTVHQIIFLASPHVIAVNLFPFLRSLHPDSSFYFSFVITIHHFFP
jgi:hypothetical protein